MCHHSRLRSRQAHGYPLHNVRAWLPGGSTSRSQPWTGHRLIGCRESSTGYATTQPAARPCVPSPSAVLPASSLASRQKTLGPPASGYGVTAHATESAARDCDAAAAAVSRATVVAGTARTAAGGRASAIGPVAGSAASPDASIATNSAVVVPAFARRAGIVAVTAAARRDGNVVVGAVVRMVGDAEGLPVLPPGRQISRQSRPRASRSLSR
jgi:hypothetical protein